MNNMIKETQLNIPDNYPTFGEFYTQNKSLIFKTLIDAYREVSNDHKLTIKVNINATVEEIPFDAHFIINKNDDDIIERLNNLYLPYYEKIEEYETCDEIKEIYKKIKGV